ncbi:translation initiation factor IF-2-like [Camelus ferus]|uniref:Translation initiation factor IF-2-like n=1 Tax=Camelus ferus TaxID=419612 RepID=A0A8B8SGQ2_CAMFR|nr:translation initiation factor IF-2-like [Camelus ferus]
MKFRALLAPATPSPPLSTRAAGSGRTEAAPKAPRRRRRLLSGCSQSPAGRGSRQLLSTSADPRAKQHASCASLPGAEPVSGGGEEAGPSGRRLGADPGPPRPGPPPRPGSGGLLAASTPRRREQRVRGARAARTRPGHARGSEKAGAGAGLSQVLRPGVRPPPRTGSGRGWATVPSPPPHPTQLPALPLGCQFLDPSSANYLGFGE